MGTEWGSLEEKADVISTLTQSHIGLARHGNVRILLGEFGVYSKALQDSCIHWMAFVREQAGAYGCMWAYWEMASGLGAYDPSAGVWSEDLLKALIP